MDSVEGDSAFPADTRRRLGGAQSCACCLAAPLPSPQGDLRGGREERGPVAACPTAPCVSIPPRRNRVWAGWRHLSLYFAFPDIATTIQAWHGAVQVGFGSLFTSFTPTFWWVVAHFSSFEKALILVLFTQPHVSPPTPIYGSRKKTSVTTQQGPRNILVFLRVLLVASCDRPGLGSKGSRCCLS